MTMSGDMLSEGRSRALKEAAVQRDKRIGRIIDESLEFYGWCAAHDREASCPRRRPWNWRRKKSPFSAPDGHEKSAISRLERGSRASSDADDHRELRTRLWLPCRNSSPAVAVEARHRRLRRQRLAQLVEHRWELGAEQPARRDDTAPISERVVAHQIGGRDFHVGGQIILDPSQPGRLLLVEASARP